MTSTPHAGSRPRDAHRLTALLGERLRSRLPGYRVALAGHAAALSADDSPTTAVVIEVGSVALHILCWVEATSGPGAEWAPHTVEVRIVLRSREQDGNIVDVVGGSVDVDTGEPDTGEVLERMTSLLEDEIRGQYDDDPVLAAEIRTALRTFDSDPFPR